MNSSEFEQGDIITANILFSDQVGIKPRPALVISNTDYNKKYSDVIVLKVTSSKENPFPYNIDISPNDLTSGALLKESTIMTDFIVTLEKEQVIRKIAHISDSKLNEVKRKMRELLKL